MVSALRLQKKFAGAGSKVVLAARNVEKLNNIVKEIDKPEDTLIVQTDMTKRDEVEQLAKRAVGTFGPIDIYVNGAGVMLSSTVKDGDVDDWDLMIDINIKGVLYGIHSVLADMKQRGSGHIINIASDAAYEVIPRCTV